MKNLRKKTVSAIARRAVTNNNFVIPVTTKSAASPATDPTAATGSIKENTPTNTAETKTAQPNPLRKRALKRDETPLVNNLFILAKTKRMFRIYYTQLSLNMK